MSHQDEIFNLKTVEFAPDGGECVRCESALEVAKTADIKIVQMRAEITQAQEELARLQSGIATLRADLINRRNVLVRRFRSVAAHQGAYMLPEIAVIEDVLRALGALVPEEAEQCCQEEQNDH